MTRARDIADLAGAADAGTVTGANLIINGDMAVAQRGTSSTSNGYATVDRFNFGITNTDELAFTQSQSTDAPDGFSNSFKVVATTAESAVASNERIRFMHFIEAQDLQQLGFGTSFAKTTTLSFYVKSNVTGTYGFSMYQADSGRLIGGTYTINSADTWEKKTLTFVGDTSGSINDDNGQGFGMEWYLLAGSGYTGTDNTSWVAGSADKRAFGHTADWGETTNDYWQITGVKLEVGDTATDFLHESYAENLAKCQRYFAKSYRGDKYAGDTSNLGWVQTEFHENNQGTGYREYYSFPFPVRMRSTPTITIYDTQGNVGKCNYYIGATTANYNKTLNVGSINERTWGGYSDRATTIGGWACHYYADAEL